MRAFGLILLLLFSLTANAQPSSDNDLFSAAQALLRWQVKEHKISADGKTRYYVSVAGKDMPKDSVAALENTGIKFLPGTSFKMVDPAATVGPDWSIYIDKPKPRADGKFDVDWGYHCGMLCASGNTAIMSHDKSGWHVETSAMHWIS